MAGQPLLALLHGVVGLAAATNLNNYGYACVNKDSVTKFKFCDSSLDVEARLDDLVPRISPHEAGQQLTARESNALPDIDVPAYYWGTNAIHGLQEVDCLKSGKCPTSFPAPCGLGAAWNSSIVSNMARIIALEMRAYLNMGLHNSLDSWSPTINLNRDPRWGRNVESPSEDPLLNSDYGVAYTTALQEGDDPRYLQAVVTLKHWIAYSLESYANETRHTFDAKVSAYDLADSYYPAFKAAITKGNAQGVMCSYNELNGVPTCGNKALTSVLRDQWNFTGYITSDTDACEDIWKRHVYKNYPSQAAGLCIESGTDIDSGNTYSDYLEKAFNLSEASQDAINAALRNTYRMRMNVGLFDPNVTSVYRELGEEVVGSESHQALSLHAARQSMVLLKNEDNTLPIPLGANVAVLGLSANTTKDLLGNYLGPICPNGEYDCYPSIYEAIERINSKGSTILHDDVDEISEAIEIAKSSDFVVLVASNSRDGGKEGTDRVTIGLDSKQQQYCEAVLKAIETTDVKSTLLLINGGAISIDTLMDMSSSILEAFSPGTQGAQAVGETLFGEYNPGGKLPITIFPKDYIYEVDFLNMSMNAGTGRTYRYYTGNPLFKFGFGLSYTNFEMNMLPSKRNSIASLKLGVDNSYTVTVQVHNIGIVAGDEVVQVYLQGRPKTLKISSQTAIKTLVGYQRVHLEAGESKNVSIEISANAFSFVNKDGHRFLYPGGVDLHVTRGHGEAINIPFVIMGEKPVLVEKFSKWW